MVREAGVTPEAPANELQANTDDGVIDAEVVPPSTTRILSAEGRPGLMSKPKGLALLVVSRRA